MAQASQGLGSHACITRANKLLEMHSHEGFESKYYLSLGEEHHDPALVMFEYTMLYLCLQK